MSVLRSASAILRKKGLRVTPQREAIYRLLANSKEHPTAEYVFKEVRKIFPSVSFNTVYKTLLAFEEAGLIQRFNTGQNIYHYDANVRAHPHFICLICGRVDDLEGYPEDLGDFISKAKTTEPREIKYVSLHFYGYCPQCGSNTKTNLKEEKENG